MKNKLKIASALGFIIALNSKLASAQPVIEQARFIFEFQRCTLIENSVPLKCDFLVRNAGNRRTLNVYSSKSRLFDARGNEISGYGVSLGGEEYRSTFNTQIPGEITLKGSIIFPKVPEDKIVGLDLNFYTDEGEFNVFFRFQDR